MAAVMKCIHDETGRLILVPAEEYAAGFVVDDYGQNASVGYFHSPTSSSTTWKMEDAVASVTYEAMVSPELHHRSQTAPVIYIIFYSVVFVLATMGNLLVIMTLICNKRMGTVTNYFLLSLALSDFLLALVCIPITLVGRILERFVFGVAMCKIMPYLMGLSVSVSTFTMLAISIERYCAICCPLQSRRWQTKSHACKVILGIWLLCFVMNLPFALFSDIVKQPIKKLGICTEACRLRFPYDEVGKAWYLFLLIILFCIPGIVMSVAYGFVCKTIYQGFQFSNTKDLKSSKNLNPSAEIHSFISKNDSHSNTNLVSNTTSDSRLTTTDLDSRATHSGLQHAEARAKSMNGFKGLYRAYQKVRSKRIELEVVGDNSRLNQTRKQLEAKKKVVEMLIVILLFFFICWTPLFFANVWKAFDPHMARRKLQYVIGLFQLLSYISTCVNPVVYCFLNQRFRQAFLNIFCFCCGCLPIKCRPSAIEHKNQRIGQQSTVMYSVASCSTV